jgi:Aromatic acid exporter family member 2
VEALLVRNGWTDVHFIADHFAIIYMCANATKTGNALPQITPSPLVDRFYTRLEGLRIAKVDRNGIPEDVDADTLHDWQYALYSIGCTLSFAICYVHSPFLIGTNRQRLDRLMMMTKALVGEVYQIEHWKSKQRLWHPRVPPELEHIYSTRHVN